MATTETETKIKNQISENSNVIEFLNTASMDDMLAVANVIKMLNGEKANAKLSITDYYSIQDAVEGLV
jgi:hypothetical protein